MTYKIYPEQDIEDIAKAIRSRNGSSEKYTVSEMADAINNFDIYSLVGEDNAPYLYRQAPNLSSDYNREHDTIIGGTVVWNQLVNEIKQGNWVAENGVTIDFEDDVIVVSSTTVNNGAYCATPVMFKNGHKYLVTSKVKTETDLDIVIVGGLSSTGVLKPKSIQAGQWVDNSYVAQSIVDETSRFYCYARSTQYSNLRVKDFMVFDLTAMFGTTIADYIYSLEQTNEGSGVAWFKKLFPNDYYEYNAGELKSVEGVSAHVTTGKNLLPPYATTQTKNGVTFTVNDDGTITANGTASATTVVYLSTYVDLWANGSYILNGCPSTGGDGQYCLRMYKTGGITYQSEFGNGVTFEGSQQLECAIVVWKNQILNNVVFSPMIRPASVNDASYEPYIKHSYPLDNSLTLRGILKLDSTNNLYYDGDIYKSDGTVTRKYGVVDLGTLDWAYRANPGIFQASLDFSYATDNAIESISSVYPFRGVATSGSQANVDGTFSLYTGNTLLWICDKAYTDASAFKASLLGQKAVIPLAEPTTVQAELFSAIQICDPNGTEEYVTTGIPVGHETKYLEVVETVGANINEV